MKNKSKEFIIKKAAYEFIIKKAYINKANGQKNISIPKWFNSKGNYFKILRLKKLK